MKILKWVRRESSGLMTTSLEMAKYEARLGHDVAIREPQGALLWGRDFEPDVETIHSQLAPTSYHNKSIKAFVNHGEPLSSFGNGVSFKAIIDLASVVDFMISMRRAELPIWNMIRRTYYVQKGIDLEVFKPLEGVEKLAGEPSVLVYENIRQNRNPVYIIAAMVEVCKKLPKAQLHIVNITDKRVADTLSAWVKFSKLWTFLRTLSGPVKAEEVPKLLNSADIIVSALAPLSARGIESLGCNRCYISAGYDGGDGHYPWIVPSYSVEDFAETIVSAWENYDKVNYREHAEKYHDEAESSRQRCEIYERYL